MNKKRILIVSAKFYPHSSPRSFRTTELAKGFARQGHEVVVYIPFYGFDYTSFAKENHFTIKDLGPLRLRTLKSKGKGLESQIRRSINRIMQLLFEYPTIELMFKVSSRIKHETGYDLLISIATPFPIHWGVSRIWDRKKKIAKIWIADCGDPYMFSRLDTFKKAFYFKYFEKSFCRKCDLISVPHDKMRSQFYEEFRSKITIIPQGFDFTETRRLNNSIPNERTTFVFAGSIIPRLRDLTLFLDFLTQYKEDFLFIIYTSQAKWFEDYKNKLQNRLEIRGYIDRQSLILEMSKVDFLVNVDTVYDCKSNVEAVPSKLIDYTLSGRPILNINASELDVEKVKEFLSGDYSRSRNIDISKYDIRIVTSQFLQAGEIYLTRKRDVKPGQK